MGRNRAVLVGGWCIVFAMLGCAEESGPAAPQAAAPNQRDARVPPSSGDSMGVPGASRIDAGTSPSVSMDAVPRDSAPFDAAVFETDLSMPVDQGRMPVDEGASKEPVDAAGGADAEAAPEEDAAHGLDAAFDFGEADAAPVVDAARGRDAAGPVDPTPEGVGVLISEYVEGSANNKALELFNGGAAPVSLAGCVVEVFANGRGDPSADFVIESDAAERGEGALGVVLEPFGRYVICNTRAGEVLLPRCQQTTGWLNFNGNDAVILRCGDAVRDAFGQVGVDPGDAWVSGEVRTVDTTLRRDCDVNVGDGVIDDAFDPGVGWTAFAQDTFDGLGAHCGHMD